MLCRSQQVPHELATPRPQQNMETERVKANCKGQVILYSWSPIFEEVNVIQETLRLSDEGTRHKETERRNKAGKLSIKGKRGSNSGKQRGTVAGISPRGLNGEVHELNLTREEGAIGRKRVTEEEDWNAWKTKKIRRPRAREILWRGCVGSQANCQRVWECPP